MLCWISALEALDRSRCENRRAAVRFVKPQNKEDVTLNISNHYEVTVKSVNVN